MKELKGFALITAFSVFFFKASYVMGFLVGIVSGFLSYFCVIGVSESAITSLGNWLSLGGLAFFIYWVYRHFFK